MKIKRIILPGITAIMTIGAFCSVNQCPVTARAALAPYGNITTDLVENNAVNEFSKEEDISEMFPNAENNTRFNCFQVDTNLMDSFVTHIDENGDPITHVWRDEDYTTTYGSMTVYETDAYYDSRDDNCPLPYSTYMTNTTRGDFAEPGRAYSLIREKYAVNLLFQDANTTKKPLEMKLNIADEDCIDDLLGFLDTFSNQEVTSIPFLKIDGKTLLELTYNKTTNLMQFVTHGIRAYVGYTSLVDNPNAYSGNLFIEIPFMEKIETFETYKWKFYNDEEIGACEGLHFTEFENIYLENDTLNRATDSPILLHDIDFENGTIYALSPTMPDTVGSSYRYNSDYITLNSITINNTIVVNCYPDVFDLYNMRDRMYYLQITDSMFETIPFSYLSPILFLQELMASTNDTEFQITSYSYKVNDIDHSISATVQEKVPDINNVIVNCGNFYAFKFKYIHDVQVHIARFDCVFHDEFYTVPTIDFNAYDDSIDLRVKNINAITFYYILHNDPKETPTTHSMAIVEDVESGKSFLENIFVKCNDYTVTDPDTGVIFEMIGNFTMFGGEVNEKDFEIRALYDFFHNVHFRSLVDFAYVDEKGSIVNCSACEDTNYSAAFIDENGAVTLQDIDGNLRIGYYYDEKTGILRDPHGEEVDMPINVPQPSDKFDLIGTLKIVAGVALAAVALWIVFTLIEKGKKALS